MNLSYILFLFLFTYSYKPFSIHLSSIKIIKMKKSNVKLVEELHEAINRGKLSCSIIDVTIE